MTEKEYQDQLAQLRADWGSVYVDPATPGYIRALKDPFTGALLGIKSALFAEIINRALDAVR